MSKSNDPADILQGIVDLLRAGNLPATIEAMIAGLGDLAPYARVAFTIGLQAAKADQTNGQLPADVVKFFMMMGAEKCAGDGFRQLRESFCITRSEIGDRLNMTGEAIRGWEIGTAAIPAEGLHALFQCAAERLIPVVGPLTGNNLRRIRKALGFSQREFAKQLDTSQTIIVKLEQFREEPIPESRILLPRLAKWLATHKRLDLAPSLAGLAKAKAA